MHRAQEPDIQRPTVHSDAESNDSESVNQIKHGVNPSNGGSKETGNVGNEGEILQSTQDITGNKTLIGFNVVMNNKDYEETWEPMQSIKQSDPLTLAKCTHDNGLIDDQGWRWIKRYTRDPK